MPTLSDWPHMASASRDTARAMSQENVDLVRRGFEAFNLGGREARASEAMLAPDVVLEVAIGIGDFDGVYNGRAEVRRFWQTWMAEFEDMHLDIDELVGCGERVFSAVRLLGRGRHSGVVVPTATGVPRLHAPRSGFPATFRFRSWSIAGPVRSWPGSGLNGLGFAHVLLLLGLKGVQASSDSRTRPV